MERKNDDSIESRHWLGLMFALTKVNLGGASREVTEEERRKWERVPTVTGGRNSSEAAAGPFFPGRERRNSKTRPGHRTSDGSNGDETGD
jgi:hypothetical protein